MEVVKTRYGKLIASRLDKYLGRSLFEYGEFSEGEVALFRELITKDAVVCDVGANIGAHTLVFSRLAQHVYAFEPVPLLFNAMAGMVALNELKNVTCINAGVSDVEGIMTYPDLDFGRENNLGAGQLITFEGHHPIQVYPLVTPCNFLKIDVEGMEARVLRGAAGMIKQCEPILYIEADRNVDEILVVTKELGYHAYWHTPDLFNPDNLLGKAENIWPGVASLNLLCSTHKVDGLPEA